MAIQPDILASTLRILRDKYVDNTFKNIPLVENMQNLGLIDQVDGGSKINHPVILTDHSSITQLSSGYESVNLAVKDPLRTAEHNWCDFVAPIVLTRKEELTNKGERAKVRILEARLKQTMGMVKREIEKQLIAGSSTVLTELETLNGIGTNTGWFEEGAFGGGTQTNTVGGIDKADFPTSWNNQVQDVAGNFSANGIKRMQQLIIDVQQFAPEGDVDIILASPISYGLYKDQLQLQERYISSTEQRNMAGKLGLEFAGAKMYVEPNLKVTSGGNDLSMYFLNSQLFNIYFDKDAYFEVSPMEKVSGYLAMACEIMCRMQICSSNLSGHGILTNAEA
tara:strand:+ start:4167 stop:5177 length:1011 start_codon:yes stop_codon:yes gene_type:complete